MMPVTGGWERCQNDNGDCKAFVPQDLRLGRMLWKSYWSGTKKVVKPGLRLVSSQLAMLNKP